MNGRFIISEICDAIDQSDFFCADVTGLNPNVMFELGYAIAANRRIWLIRDDSYSDAKKEFDQFGLLSTVGYSPYVNSEHIIKSFFADQPHLSLKDTIFDRSIAPMLSGQASDSSLLYLKSRHDTEASVRVTRVLEDSLIPLVLNDPIDSNLQPLYIGTPNGCGMRSGRSRIS